MEQESKYEKLRGLGPAEMAAENKPMSPISTPPPQYQGVSPYAMDSQTLPVELASPNMVYEMPDHNSK